MTRNFAGFASLRKPSFFPRYRIGKDEVSPKGAKEENSPDNAYSSSTSEL